jgi:hypothetical protein
MQDFRHPEGARYDPEFEKRVDEAIEAYTDSVREEIHRRAIDGWVERGIYDKEGNHLGDVRRYSDRLLEIHIKKHDAGYREHVSVDARAQVAGGAFISLLSDVRQLPRELRKNLLAADRELKRLAAEAGDGEDSSTVSS